MRTYVHGQMIGNRIVHEYECTLGWIARKINLTDPQLDTVADMKIGQLLVFDFDFKGAKITIGIRRDH